MSLPLTNFKKYFLLACIITSGLVLLKNESNLNTGEFYEIPLSIELTRLIGLIVFLLCMIFYLVGMKKVLLTNVFVFFLMIIIIEAGCFTLLGFPVRYVKYFEKPQFPEGHPGLDLGLSLYDDTTTQHIKINASDTVFRATYVFDEFYRRNTSGHDTSRKEHAIFFGCSVAFGLGLNGDQTFPYYFQQKNGKYNAYSYAQIGGATNHMLAILEREDLSEQVQEANGIGIYVFIWDHVLRSVGSMNRYIEWLHASPYFEYDDGNLIRKSAFHDGRPVTSWCYEHLFQTSIIRYFEIDLPFRMNDYHIKWTVEMIKKSADIYKSQFSEDDFYVVLYPSYDVCTPEQYKEFKNVLTEKNIDYIDLTGEIEYGGYYTFDGDPHPKASTNALLAGILSERIEGKDFD